MRLHSSPQELEDQCCCISVTSLSQVVGSSALIEMALSLDFFLAQNLLAGP